jgi:chaperonin cofactor prefoldin
MPRSISFAAVFILLAASSAVAQSPDAGSSQPASQTKDSPAPPDAKKPKKVWTNENLSDANGSVSVIGDPKTKPKVVAPKPADAQYAASVRKQLEKLQVQLNDVDKQLVDLKNFSNGEPSTSASGVKLDKRYEREPIEVQIRALQDKKKDLQSKIEALLDEARKKGVEPGELR